MFVVNESEGTLLGPDGDEISWNVLADRQGEITIEWLSRRHAKPVLVALEDRQNFALENWRKVFVVVNSKAGNVQLFGMTGQIIEESDESGLKQKRQPLENFLAEFDGANGRYYRSPQLRPSPQQRNRGQAHRVSTSSTAAEASTTRAGDSPPSLVSARLQHLMQVSIRLHSTCSHSIAKRTLQRHHCT